MRAKSKRVSEITKKVSDSLGLSAGERKAALRAAHLCKTDLVTNLVVEMTSLQGTVGRYYALRDGEDRSTAQAIEDHYLPRQAGGDAPRSKPGLSVGIADRLDSLVGLFAVNMAPTGTKDPFALRRSAVGLVHNLISWKVDFHLKESVEMVSAFQPVPVSPEQKQACLKFIEGRLQNILLEDGHRHDVVSAVLAEQGENPYSASNGVVHLEKWVKKDEWSEILPAFSRCVRITRDLSEKYKIKPGKFILDEEKNLYTAAEKAASTVSKNRTLDALIKEIKQMISIINQFFEKVLVMDENEAIKENRIALLQKVSGLTEGLADFSRLEGF
jgi:glycyl-tRNA synthetase